jgi:hypothetical protein
MTSCRATNNLDTTPHGLYVEFRKPGSRSDLSHEGLLVRVNIFNIQANIATNVKTWIPKKIIKSLNNSLQCYYLTNPRTTAGVRCSCWHHTSCR